MKIRNIVNLKEFDPVVDLSWADSINQQERMLSNYIMTEQLAETFVDILESLNLVRSEKRRELKSGDVDNSTTKRSHIISGQYGTGKSYFLLMLNVILSMENKNLTDMMIDKFKNFPELQYQLKVIKERKKYFVVRIKGESENEKEFKDVLQENIISRLEEHFGEVNIETVYLQLLRILENVYQKNRGAVESYLKDKDYDFFDLKAGLSNYKKSTLKDVEELIFEVMGAKPKIEIDKPDEFLKNVNKILDDNGYGELVVIFDEFSAYITASMENGRIGIDLGQIQTIAELSSKNIRDTQGIKVSLIASIHGDLKETLEKNGISKKEQLDKVFGRFESHKLNFDQGEELLKNIIEISDWDYNMYAKKHTSFITHLETVYKKNFKDFYPLHPATVAYLEPISDLYAQKTRTTFGFLKEVVKENFFNRDVETDGKLNLVTLSDLYDHFENPIGSKHPEIVEVFNQNYNALRKDGDLVNFLKALTVAHSSSFSKIATYTELSAQELKDIYQFPSEEFVREKLNPVVNNNHLNITTNEGKYRLFINSSGINIDKLIAENKDKISPYRKLKEILDKSANRIFIRDSYELKYNMGLYPFERKINGNIVSLGTLESGDLSKITRVTQDASITFLIPDFTENFDKDDIVRKYSKKMMDFPENVCLAIPNALMFDPEELKEYGAMQIIEKEHEEVLKNEEIRKMLVKRRRKLEDKLRNKYLRKFANLRNFNFIFSNGRVKNDLRQDMALFKEIFYNYYTKFPHEITVENFNNRGPVGDVEKIFINNGIGEISKSDTSAGSKQVYNTLIPLDLVSKKEKAGKFEFSFKLPTEEKSLLSKEIMDIILTPDNNLSLVEKIKKLTGAPYGLNVPLVMLYILVATKIKILTIVQKENKKFESIDYKKLDEIFNKPEKYELQKNENKVIPSEVKDVWLKLNELKIVSSSKARNFIPDGGNDFIPNAVLGIEIKTIFNNLSDKEKRISKKEIKTGKLKTFVNKLEAAIKMIKPEDLYQAVLDLPAIFRKESFQANFEEFDKFIGNLKELTGPVVCKIENVDILLMQLKAVIKDLSGFSDMKQEIIELEERYLEYKEDFLDIESLSSIDEDLNKLLSTYNNELKRRHDIYHEKFSQKVNDLLTKESDKIESLKIISEISFPNIASVETVLEEIKLEDKCEVRIQEDKISYCTCNCDNLKSVEQITKVIDENFNSYDRKIVGVFSNYVGELRNQEIREKFKFSEDYKQLIFALGRIENNNSMETDIMTIRESVKKLKIDLNNFIKNESQIDSVSNNEKVEFVELENILKLELQALGRNYVSLEEVEEKFNKLMRIYREKNIKLAKI